MSILGNSKKNKSALPSLKTISFVTGTILALNKAMKDKLEEGEHLLNSRKRKKQNNTGAIVAGLIGGLVAGAVTALLLAPESGEDLRHRVSDMLSSNNGNGYDEEAIIEEARQKAAALAAKAKDQAEQAEEGLKDN